jgi:hypothetical protein
MTKRKILALFAILILSSLVIPYAAAEEEKEEEDEGDEKGFGFGEQEREQEGEEGGLASPYSGLILYVTLGSIIAALAYTGFRIYRSKSLKKLQ